MKNLSKLFFAVLLSAVLFSCSDDDDYSKGDLKGLYVSSSYENISVVTNNDDVTKAIIEDLKDEENDIQYIYFDGQGNGIDYDVESIGADGPILREEDKFTYSFKGNALHVSYIGEWGEGYEGSAKISSLSKNGFKLDTDDTEYYQEDLGYYENTFNLEPNSLKITSVKYTASYVKKSEEKPAL